MSALAKFLFDECLGKPMMEELQQLVPAGCEFAHILDHFASGTHDDEWIPAMKGQGWIVISADSGKNRPSRGGKLPRLCKENEITHVLFGSKLHQRPGRDKLAALLLVWPEIVELHRELPGTRFGLRYQITSSGARQVVLRKVEADS